jgi:hypothetical protein
LKTTLLTHGIKLAVEFVPVIVAAIVSVIKSHLSRR